MRAFALGAINAQLRKEFVSPLYMFCLLGGESSSHSRSTTRRRKHSPEPVIDNRRPKKRMRPAGQESESAPGPSSDLGHGGRASPSPSLSDFDYDEDDGGDELEEETFPSREPAQQPQPGFSGIVHEPTSASNTSGVPPKPKRTRQLTTPYQAAILHELLAESRFPSTAKREEVGRRIGLSARKVQVWFQNQRQKARKEAKDAQAAAAAAATAAASIHPSATSAGTPYTYVPHPSYPTARDPNLVVGRSTWHSRPINPSEIPPTASPSTERYPVPWPRRPSASASEEGSSPITPGSYAGQHRAPLTGPGMPGASSGMGSSRASLSPTTRYNPRHELSTQLPPLHTVTPPLPPLLPRTSLGHTTTLASSMSLPPLQVRNDRRQSVPEISAPRPSLSRHPPSTSSRQLTRDGDEHWSRAETPSQRTSASIYSQSYSSRPPSALGRSSGSRGESSTQYVMPPRSTRFDPVRNAEEELSAERQTRRSRARSPGDD